MSQALIRRYFDAFNAGDAAGMLACVADDVEHRVNQGPVRHGKPAFAAFNAGMGEAYREEARDLVIFAGDVPGRFAAECVIHGAYLQTQDGLPPAAGQTYVLPVGSFFALRDGAISRVSTHYNLADWIAQVSR